MDRDEILKAFKKLAEDQSASAIISAIAHMREVEVGSISRCNSDFELRFRNGRISAYDDLLNMFKSYLSEVGKEIFYKVNSTHLLEVVVANSSSDTK